MNDRQPEAVFDKYIVRSKEELAELNAAEPLSGAYIITGDTQHVSIHKVFYSTQRFKHWLKQDLNREEQDTDLCHNMICIGWDAAKERPILAHVVRDGLKINATCYFTYQDQDVDFMEVFIPKDPTLKQEILHNAEQTAAISTVAANRSPFYWGGIPGAIFKSPNKTSEPKVKRSIAAAMADLFLNQPLRDEDDDSKLKPFHCAHYALLVVQVSMILQPLDNETRLSYSKKFVMSDRHVVIHALLAELNDASTLLGAAYANCQLTEINSAHITSTDVSFVLSKLSYLQEAFFHKTEVNGGMLNDNNHNSPVMSLKHSKE